MDKINSTLCSLKNIIEKKMVFNIPRYQRLYVWEKQVDTLFHDLLGAAFSEKDMYYLGGVVIVQNKSNAQLYDLVDGQQRFTTLWLLAYELGEYMRDFRQVEDGLRIRFAIRQKVTSYFESLNNTIETDNDSNSDNKDLERIDLARRRLRSLIENNLKDNEEKKKFAAYLMAQVKVVVTLVPQATDLNRLFDALNNRGEQLSQDEILKARLLAGITPSEKYGKYARLWNAVSDTHNYLERALALEAGYGYARYVADYMTWAYCYEPVEKVLGLFGEQKQKKGKGKCLENILKAPITDEERNEASKHGNKSEVIDVHELTEDDELQSVRSILSFSQLALHTLRIFRFNRKLGDISRINEKELLEIFEEYFFKCKDEKHPQKYITEFLDLLFEVRAAFDKYVVKWVEKDTNEEELILKKVYMQNRKHGSSVYYIRRIEEKGYDGIAQLQRMLYHSQQNTTQYWLTPFLYWVWAKNPSIENAYSRLKQLDNMLFCTGREGTLLTERTWECMEAVINHSIDLSILEEAEGTGFPHYWFYKIDFVLWHERAALGKEQEWDDYKFTAKNSIEHIGPQNPLDEKDKVCDKYLHRIGNLVLVTRSINSEYGASPVGVKKAKFDDKKNKGFWDSLKSDLIYQENEWNDGLASKHQEQILKLLNSYFETHA